MDKIILSDEQLDYLVKHFKDTDNGYLAASLDISESTLHRLARRYGLKKTRAYMKKTQLEVAAYAKYSRERNGTNPPKGFHIPNSELHRFKKGRVEPEDVKKRRIAKSAETRRDTIARERMRIRMGLPQKTGLKLKREPEGKSGQRYYLKKRGYLLDEEKGIAYYNADTKRATRIERKSEHYKFCAIPSF